MADRDGRGRFQKGHALAGPGRPYERREREYLKAMVEVVTENHWRGITIRAWQDALKGDRHARAWLSDYILGKPLQIFELRGEDAHLLKEMLLQAELAGVQPSTMFSAMIEKMALLEARVEGDDE